MEEILGRVEAFRWLEYKILKAVEVRAGISGWYKTQARLWLSLATVGN
jgi:hypothetical protein